MVESSLNKPENGIVVWVGCTGHRVDCDLGLNTEEKEFRRR